MSRTDEFFNVGERLGTTAPRDAARVRAVIDALLAGIAGRRPPSGVLYVPRVAGGQLWIDVSAGPLVIPAIVTLELAPGVVLVPLVRSGMSAGPSAFVAVEGAFEAPIGPVIATRGWFARHGGAEPERVGTVRFTSRRMERVCPEWWGAGDEGDPMRGGDEEALDAALRAALHDRVSNGRWLRPLVIELGGPYRLTRTWNLRRGPHPGAGLELRGTPGPESAPTFVWTPASDAGSGALSMLDVRDIESVTLEDIRFDGNRAVGACLALQTSRASVLDRGSLLRRCAFTGARHLVRVEATGSDSNGVSLLGGAVEDLRIEHCAFRPTLGSGGATPVGLHVTATGAGVEVRGCRFEGDAAAMIHCRGGALSVTSCHFANELIPSELRNGERTEDLHAAGPSGGVDVFLDRGPASPPARVYAQDCYSRSAQFLATCRGAASDAGGDSVIVALHHVNSVAVRPANIDPFRVLDLRWKPLIPVDKLTDGPKDGPGVPRPPGAWYQPPLPVWPPLPSPVQVRAPAPIHWRIDRTASSGLLLTGCRFDQLGDAPAVRAFAGCSGVGNLGLLGAPLRADDPATEMIAPLLSAR